MKETLLATTLGLVMSTAAVSTMAMPAPIEKGMEVQVTGQAAMSVANDEAEVTFSAIESSKTAKVASDKVVARTNSALAALKKSPLMEAISSMRTTTLSVNPRYTRGTEKAAPEIDGWEAVSRLSVTVKNLEKMSDIMQLVNKDMTYEGVSFSVSRETRQRYEEKLLADATKNSIAKLNTIAKTLGLDEGHVKLVKLNTETNMPGAVRYYAAPRMAKMANTMDAAPQVEAGDTDLELRVSAEALIMP